jgi:hypothetical protein
MNQIGKIPPILCSDSSGWCVCRFLSFLVLDSLLGSSLLGWHCVVLRRTLTGSKVSPVMLCSVGTQQLQALIFYISRFHLSMQNNLLTEPLTCQAANNPNISQNRSPRKSCICQPMLFFFRWEKKRQICLVLFGLEPSKWSLHSLGEVGTYSVSE